MRLNRYRDIFRWLLANIFFHCLVKIDRDELMYALADILPESLRGDYADLSLATTNTIELQ